MYTRQESSRLIQAFWTAFGRYMAPLPSADGRKVNWVNYKTGERQLRLLLEAGPKEARIGLVLTHPDPVIRASYYALLQQLRASLHEVMGEDWNWEEEARDDTGRPVSQVTTRLEGLSIYRQEDWPALISFFKPRLLALDRFWNDSRFYFEALR